MSAGRLFHSVGAASKKERSASVFFDLKQLYDRHIPVLVLRGLFEPGCTTVIRLEW